MAPKTVKRKTLAVAVYNGLLGFEYGIVAELFGLVRPGTESDWYDFQPCRVEKGDLRSSHGLTIKPSHSLLDLANADTIVVPGWRSPLEGPKPAFVKALRSGYENGARIISVCTGAFVLGHAGLLDGKRVTTHWMYADELQTRFPKSNVVADAIYVHDGRVSTSAGSSAGLDLCLCVIRQDFGIQIANMVARRMVAPVHREGGQSQYVEPRIMRGNSDGFGPILDWMEQNLADQVTVAQIASKFSMSLRSFQRRFTLLTGVPPLVWINQQRVTLARNLLEATDQSIDQIAAQSGMGTAANLRKHFDRHLNVTPSAYRSSFKVTEP